MDDRSNCNSFVTGLDGSSGFLALGDGRLTLGDLDFSGGQPRCARSPCSLSLQYTKNADPSLLMVNRADVPPLPSSHNQNALPSLSMVEHARRKPDSLLASEERPSNASTVLTGNSPVTKAVASQVMQRDDDASGTDVTLRMDSAHDDIAAFEVRPKPNQAKKQTKGTTKKGSSEFEKDECQNILLAIFGCGLCFTVVSVQLATMRFVPKNVVLRWVHAARKLCGKSSAAKIGEA